MSVLLSATQTHQQSYNSGTCYHCGENCPNKEVVMEDKQFCCQGCMSVYQLLNNAGLCTYYDLNEASGINKRNPIRADKFAFLDDDNIQHTLIHFKQDGQVYINFYIPYIHCSSCIYLLERLHQLHPGVIRVDIQFLKKEVSIVFEEQKTTLRKVVETLTAIGYEPHISLQSMNQQKPAVRKSLIYRLGVAGFCFGNIMLLSFPEYFSEDVAQEQYLGNIFRYISFALSIPVFFYSALEFFSAAWKGLKHKHLNIDAPVSLAIIVCFVRSIIDIYSGTGSGFLDSMSGIVFFMLVGRVLQDKTYRQLSFERDYTDYFPIAATVVKGGKDVSTALPDIKVNDTLKIHNSELIPADGILVKGHAQIDYSFVTGEATPVQKEIGELVYAGGKQLGGQIEILTVKEVAQSYLTGLWNKNRSGETKDTTGKTSTVHVMSRYFTWVVFAIAAVAGIYWSFFSPEKVWPSVTAVLIVACPCALLLTATFNNGYIMRILGRNGMFLRNAFVIEALSKLNYLVFDKTGTLTSPKTITAVYHGTPLSDAEKVMIASVAVPSVHAFSLPLQQCLNVKDVLSVSDFKEFTGLGAKGYVSDVLVEVGTAAHLQITELPQNLQGTALFVRINGKDLGYFELQQGLRQGIAEMIQGVKAKVKCALLSGDYPYQQQKFASLLGQDVALLFEQKPEDKRSFITAKQQDGFIVGMVGDGLNDAGALQQSNVGICIADNTNSFTPAGDVILEGKKLPLFRQLLQLCIDSKYIIRACFAFSILYNLIGLYFAVQGLLSPLIAAILMPCSTLSIVLITYISSNVMARRLGLK